MLLILFFGVIASATKFSFSSVQFAFQRWSVNLLKKSCSNRYRCGVFAKSLQRLPEEGLELKLLGCFIMISLLIVVFPLLLIN